MKLAIVVRAGSRADVCARCCGMVLPGDTPPSADLILPEGSKRIRRQAYTAALTNLSTLSGYYAGFATGLVKDINQTRSLSLYWDNLPPKLKNLKELRKHPLTTGF
jgi:hypothetical protein